MIISIQNPKGGTGKSTLAVNLAACLSRSGSVHVLDSDQQASVIKWAEARKDGERPFMVSALSSTELVREAPKLARNVDWLIIDGQGRSNAIARAGIMVADLVLAPVQLSAMDAREIPALLSLIHEVESYREPVTLNLVVSRQRIPQTREARAIEQELREARLPLLESRTWERVDYDEASSRGLSVFDDTVWRRAAEEIEKIAEELGYGD